MKRVVLISVLIGFVFSACNKCGDYQLKNGKDCLDWNERFAGTWSTEFGPYCNGGELFGGDINLESGSAPNLVVFNDPSLTNPLVLTMPSSTIAEGGPWNLEDQGEPYTFRLKLTYTPGTGSVMIINGQLTNSGAPPEIYIQMWRNEGTNNEVACSTSIY